MWLLSAKTPIQTSRTCSSCVGNVISGMRTIQNFESFWTGKHHTRSSFRVLVLSPVAIWFSNRYFLVGDQVMVFFWIIKDCYLNFRERGNFHPKVFNQCKKAKFCITFTTNFFLHFSLLQLGHLLEVCQAHQLVIENICCHSKWWCQKLNKDHGPFRAFVSQWLSILFRQSDTYGYSWPSCQDEI